MNNNLKLLDPKKSPYFQELGLVSKKGFPKKSMEHKYHQVQQTIIYLDQALKKSNLKKNHTLKVWDMGSGKGYLTFAVYDFLNNYLNLDSYVTGVDTNDQLINKNKKLAEKLSYNGIDFINSNILDVNIDESDIIIALHACDTATDHTIYQAIKSNAEIVILAPCCHNQVFTQIQREDALYEMLKHSNMRESFSRLLTDTLRVLYLEKNNYNVQVFKFVPDPHTPMNSMIRGVKQSREITKDQISQKNTQILQLLKSNDIEEFELKKLINSD